MTSDHNAEHSSPASRCGTFGDATDSNMQLQTAASSRRPFARHASLFSMPSVELLQYANKGSVRVNAGLKFGGSDDQLLPSGSAVPFCTNMPVVDIDFAQLIAPIVVPEPKPSTESLVHRLLHPPSHAFVHGTLSMHWVLGAVGKHQFKFRTSDERYVLTSESELRRGGISLGIPLLYIEWLNGDDETLSATEQGMHLTRTFFEGLHRKH